MGMTFNESTAVITRIGNAQAELLDHSGHVNRGLGRAKANELVGEINNLRHRVGWKPLDMAGRWKRQGR
jgi:hypothetical protein